MKTSREALDYLKTSYSRSDLTEHVKYIEKAFESATTRSELALVRSVLCSRNILQYKTPINTRTQILNNASTLFLRLAKEEKTTPCALYVPISACIMSRFPYFKNFKSFLRSTWCSSAIGRNHSKIKAQVQTLL